ncbi:MAG: hypothetical protein RL022_1986 [Chloroflexota bacterium]|jgi:hypothetical protein
MLLPFRTLGGYPAFTPSEVHLHPVTHGYSLEQIKHDASRLRGGRSSGVSVSPWLRMNLLMLGTFILTLAIGLTVIFWP